MRNDRSMKRFAVVLASLALAPLAGAGAVLAPAAAEAQIASGGGPIDVTANELEMVDAQKLAIWRGKVEAVQGTNRMLADQLNVYFANKGGAAPSASAPAGAAPASGVMGKNWGEVQRLVADGNVFFISPQQTARGEHAVYEVVPDTITMTGNVAIVTGENVVKGDKVVIEVKTGHANIVSDVSGRNQSQRVRGVFYSNPVAPAKPGAAAASAPAPAK
jgi:lipopolysaccharide export system protein LptA